MSKKLSKDDRLDLVFHALADRTRRAQLAQLTKGSDRISDLAAPFDMTLAAASKHVRVLEAAGLVSRSVDGRVHLCSLQAEPLREIERWIKQYQPFWTDALDALADFAESGKPTTREKKK